MAVEEAEQLFERRKGSAACRLVVASERVEAQILVEEEEEGATSGGRAGSYTDACSRGEDMVRVSVLEQEAVLWGRKLFQEELQHWEARPSLFESTALAQS